MPAVRGRIERIVSYEEEGRTDWALAVSKILWFLICVLAPLSLFRFANDLFGPFIAFPVLLLLLVIMRLLGPVNLVFLDELLARIFPSLRSAVRTGRVRVYDFRLRMADGRQMTCILRGDPRGGVPMQGDNVTLTGRERWGALHIEHGRNESTGSVIMAERSHSSWILLVTLSIAAVFSLYLWGAFDAWIYPKVVEWLSALLEEA